MTRYFGELKVVHRILFFLPVLAAVVLLFIWRDLTRTERDMMSAHELQLHAVVDAAIGTVNALYAKEEAAQLTHEQAVAQAREALHAFTFDGKQGFIFVQDYNGVSIVNRIKGVEGQNRIDMVDPDGVPVIRKQIENAKAGGGLTFYRAPAQGDRGAARRVAYNAPFAPWQWSIGAAVYIDDVEAAFASAARAQILIGAAALLVACGVTLLIGRSISRPLSQITATMAALAEGDLGIAPPFAGQRNEFGRLSAALNVFKENALAVRRLREEQEAAKERADAERRGEMLKLADHFESATTELVKSVASAASNMHQSADSLAVSATVSSGQANAAAQSSKEASLNVNIVAAATQQLSASISEITKQVAFSATISQEAVDQAKSAQEEVTRLTEAAAHIGEVINLIKSIAGQTNLLALNATIEASRAGDAGKGFAVVASEVKALAGQVARATGDIEGRVSVLQDVSGRSALSMAHIASTIGRVSEAAGAIAAAVEQQGAATEEIASNVQQAATKTEAVSSNIAGLDAAVRETESATAQVKSASATLAGNADELANRVSNFLSGIRAA